MRLGNELRALRKKAGLTHEQLARKVGQARMKFSRLENGRIRPDVGDIIKVLDALDVDGGEWNKLVNIARDAADQGWWHRIAEQMGIRQAMYADLEAGAATIRAYEQNFIPGLLQTQAYLESRDRTAASLAGSQESNPLVWEGRAGRQRMLQRPGGTTYEVIIDEIALRRLSVSAPVMAEQLEHMLAVQRESDRITIRILPVDALVPGYSVPWSSYSIFTYPDAEDPVVAAVEMSAVDELLADPEHVNPLVAHFERLREASLSPMDSEKLLSSTAQRLTDRR
ncbi:transcriptional regulator [Actinorhabdospora filicis]|uniref:Transcriptional regulator n=2 Tax=Actinorhabdospora filicis TaxID=1785913 RepID=A0A9W6SVZ2_9ACTN|nr:transcriptional regulator [Actinorhabdospora filicis]